MQNQTKLELASKRIERELKRFLGCGNKIKHLDHDQFAVKYGRTVKRVEV